MIKLKSLILKLFRKRLKEEKAFSIMFMVGERGVIKISPSIYIITSDYIKNYKSKYKYYIDHVIGEELEWIDFDSSGYNYWIQNLDDESIFGFDDVDGFLEIINNNENNFNIKNIFKII